MAKYEVTFSCGHTETKELYGKSADRERKIAWMEEHGICNECYKKQLQEQQDARKAENGLPDLTGSEKQVAWAERLRDGFFLDWDKLGPQKDPRAEKFVHWLQSQTEARFWIDNREKSIREVAKEWMANENKIEAIVEAKDLETAAKEEATVYPENEQVQDVAEISHNGEFVEVKSPKNDIIIETVKAAGYKWDGEKARWCMKITKTRGKAEDRAAEIGNLLLNAGVPVRIYDERVRHKAVAADFAPQQHQWVLKCGDEEVEVFWRTKEHSLYEEAKRLPHAKYREGTIHVPSRYFAEILEFAKLYDLGVSEEAAALLAKEEKAYKDKMVVSPKKAADGGKKSEKLKDIMESSRDVLEDLRDED